MEIPISLSLFIEFNPTVAVNIVKKNTCIFIVWLKNLRI